MHADNIPLVLRMFVADHLIGSWQFDSTTEIKLSLTTCGKAPPFRTPPKPATNPTASQLPTEYR
jgi:hypothetical protein